MSEDHDLFGYFNIAQRRNLKDGQVKVSGTDVLDVLARLTFDDDADMFDDKFIATMRRLGKAIGMDPVDVTPYQLRRNYSHRVTHIAQRTAWSKEEVDKDTFIHKRVYENYCTTCGLSDGDKVHK